MLTSNATGVQHLNTKGVFESNGFVTYVSIIQDLDGIVSQLTSYLSKQYAYTKCIDTSAPAVSLRGQGNRAD